MRRGSEDRRFRRLAAQLGVSRHVLGGSEDREEAGEAPDASESVGVEPSDSPVEEAPEAAEELVDNEEEDEDVGELSLTLPSDSASEGLSSDLSLPHSFGHYDPMGVSHFDDHLTRFSSVRLPSGRTNRLQSQRGLSAGTDGESSIADGSEAVMKKFYEIQVGKIRAQLALSVQAQREMEKTLQQERVSWQEKAAAKENNFVQERNRLEKELVQTREELKATKTRLKMEKTHFATLQISDALAEQLSRQDEDDLSIREYVQLSIYRKVRSLETELEHCRQETSELINISNADKAVAAGAADEVVQIQRIAASKERRLQNELELSETTRKELESQIKALVEQLDFMKEEQRRNEEIYSDQKAFQRESERLKRDLQMLQLEHNDLQSRFDKNASSSGDLNQKIAMLTADKAFLQDAKTQLEEQLAAMRTSHLELQEKANKLQEKYDSSLSESTQLQNETRLHFEKKLDDEMAKFMELSKREIERIRNDGQVVYERENRLLKEARDDALKHVEMLQSRLDSVQSAHDEKVLEMTRLESTHTTAISSARNELKMRHFEINQLKVTLEDKATSVRSGSLQIEMLTKKVEAHKEEFARLESTSTTRITQLEAILEVERNKLKEYELLEIDLDKAVVQTGEVAAREEDGDANADASAEVGSTLQDAMTTFGAIPTTTKRRFQQSVLLAQRVVKSQREAMALEQRLADMSAARTGLEHEIVELKTKLANFHQPQSYLIDKLARKEEELQIANRRCHEAQSQLKQLRAQYQHVQDANASLQHQIQQLLSRRGDLDALKATVQMLRGKIQSQRQQQPANQQLPANEFSKPPTPMAASSDRIQPSPSIARIPPSLASKMTRPPTPQHRNDDLSPGQRVSVVSSVSSNISNTPKWYTKLRAPMQQQAQ
ncbi:Progesterone-induced-blocking factor 1 [Phytophthora boehmeriae]|uniref:Progesterone-induced-blocking factor 1 n=1 Tax=Phytophthora boehmeriae TaxID=109152 RepID=A0A8T1X9J6_9STRA|nr:Progesterone-induced-blocking factor 1 [Phytophthora boehmeriae]